MMSTKLRRSWVDENVKANLNIGSNGKGIQALLTHGNLETTHSGISGKLMIDRSIPSDCSLFSLSFIRSWMACRLPI